MSESTPENAATETPAEQQPNETPSEAPATHEPKPTETVDFWKQKAREQEKRAKDNADAARRLSELEESQKSEQQKVADRAAAAERARDEAVADGLRYKAAAKHGIGEDYFDLLGSGDEETIAGRAERIGGLLRLQSENEQLKAEVEALKAGKPTPQQHRPTASLKPGATAEEITSTPDTSYPSHWLPSRQPAS